MKNLIITSVRTLQTSLTSNSKNNRKTSIDFAKGGLSRGQMAAIKGGDDIVIIDLNGSHNGSNSGNTNPDPNDSTGG